MLAGPTAVGKGTVADEIRRSHPDVWISVSATTRRPRPGERDGVHYRFVDDAAFDAMVAAGDLLEWAFVHRTARYGTPRRPVEEALAAGRLALLEIDLQGARQVRETMPDALFV
ncbi:MAG: guanylate kinase, partial [Nocardioidaceae bacterium]|nr:guanylate kinase [Nocardioidaceae bacterium]